MGVLAGGKWDNDGVLFFGTDWMKILEIKRHLNKPDETYICDLMARGPNFLVLRYVSDRAWRVAGQVLEAGTTTLAYYESGKGFVFWKMVGDDGALKGYLFHICKDLDVLEDRVQYLDLLLDLWFDPEGVCTVLDRDELDVCYKKGQIGDADLAWILTQEQKLKENFQGILSHLEGCLAEI